MYLCKKDEIGMDCEQYKKAKKIYFRFLKDHGIFSRVIWLHKNGDECSIKREAPMTLDDALHYCKNPTEWIQSAICFCIWSKTDEGQVYWHELSKLWKLECIEKGLKTENTFIENYIKVCENSAKFYADRQFTTEIMERVKRIKDKNKELF